MALFVPSSYKQKFHKEAPECTSEAHTFAVCHIQESIQQVMFAFASPQRI